VPFGKTPAEHRRQGGVGGVRGAAEGAHHPEPVPSAALPSVSLPDVFLLLGHGGAAL